MAADLVKDPTPGPPSPPLRVVVKCRSHHIPGKPQSRLATMGNLICQHLWGRNMERERDFIRTNGFPSADGERVGFLLDTGTVPPNTEPGELPILVYRWNGESMKTRQLTNELRIYVQSFPFRRENAILPASARKTLSERRSEMTEDEWNKLMEHAVSQKIRYRKNISKTEREWLESHPQELDKIMQHHILRRQWNNCQLWKTQVLWLDARQQGAATSDLTLIHQILEQHQIEIKTEFG